MDDDLRRRLRSLDEVETGDLWHEVRARSARPETSPRPMPLGRRLGTIALAGALFAAAGAFLVTRFDRSSFSRNVPSPSDAVGPDTVVADRLRIICTRGGAEIVRRQVGLQTDGLHVSIRNDSGQTFFYMRDPKKIGQSVGIELTGPSVVDRVLSTVPPGTWVARCGSGSFNTHEVPLRAYSPPFEIVDPHGHWAALVDSSQCGEAFPAPVATAGTDAPLAGPLIGWLTVHAWDHRTGQPRVFLVRADGTDAREVHVDARPIHGFELAPDGSRVVMVINDDFDGDPQTYFASRDDSEIYVANADGSDLRRLTNNRASDDLPKWTPDGRISFRSNRDGPLTIYTMDADGRNVSRFVNGSADRHDWSPTDSRVAYVGDTQPREDGCPFSRELIVANRDGSGAAELTHDELYQQSPAWSPDGKTIAFIASDQSDYAWEVFLVNADGSDLRRLTDYDGYDHGPVWSPDGTMIAFTSDRFLGVDRHGESQGGLPYVMNADGSGVRPLLDPSDLPLDGPWDVYVTDWRA